MGVLVDRVHRELTAEEIGKIAGCYHAWKSKDGRAGSPLPAAGGKTSERRARSDAPYQDELGFCKSVKLEEIQTHGYVLTPGRYVGAADVEDDGEPFAKKMKRLTATLEEQFTESGKLEKTIRGNLKALNL